jgi:hypothetical protein
MLKFKTYLKLNNQNINKISSNKYLNNVNSSNDNKSDENKKLHIPVMLDEVIKYLVDDVKHFKVINFCIHKDY